MDRRNDSVAEESQAETRRLILNPTSGHGTHAGRVHELAEKHGFPVKETRRRGHAEKLTKRAVADGVDLLAACGGDGTVHEVVQGLVTSNALDSVTLCIIPVGTENIIATDIGILTMADGFEIAECGETRQIDLGMVADEPFVMSAIVGLPAEVSDAATHDLKQQFGSFAFIVSAVKKGLTYESMQVEIDAAGGAEEATWSGEALAVLVGNLRRFSKEGGQANAEDGFLEVTIVERMPSTEVAAEAIAQRLLHRDTPHVQTLKANRLDVSSLTGEAMTYSLDGEIREFESVHIRVLSQVVRLRVGNTYNPNPRDQTET